MKHEAYIRQCYSLAIRAGKKGFDTFGALLVHNDQVLEEAENTADYQRGLFGHAEFNLVHQCANKYSDAVLQESVLYTSCAPCERCLAAIAPWACGGSCMACPIRNSQSSRPLMISPLTVKACWPSSACP